MFKHYEVLQTCGNPDCDALAAHVAAVEPGDRN